MHKIGQLIPVTVTGVRPYGAFVRTDDGTNGLIHISEISEFYIKDVGRFFNKGEKLVVKIIDIDQNGQLRLSLKAIQSNRKGAIPTKREISAINTIGFESLREKLPVWISQAKKENK